MVDLQVEATSSSSNIHVDPTIVRLDFVSHFYLHPSECVGSSLLLWLILVLCSGKDVMTW